MPEASIVLRDSTDADIPAIARIYGHWVRHGLASFELEPPDAAEMARRRAAVLGGGYPYIVATDAAGQVLGYAYASAYRARPAHRFAIENSIGAWSGRGQAAGPVRRSMPCRPVSPTRRSS